METYNYSIRLQVPSTQTLTNFVLMLDSRFSDARTTPDDEYYVVMDFMRESSTPEQALFSIVMDVQEFLSVHNFKGLDMRVEQYDERLDTIFIKDSNE